MSSRANRKITGYHAAAMLVGFFAIVIAVNFTMAHFALSSFGGTMVDNSYVASQKYNGWLAQAERQAALGWHVGAAQRQQAGSITLQLSDADGVAMQDAQIAIIAEHPLGQSEARKLTLHHIADGLYRSGQPLPAGRWRMRIEIRNDGHIMRLLQEIQ